MAAAEDDLRTMEFIKGYLPHDVKDKFTEDDIYYFMDLLADYYVDSGLLDDESSDDDFVDIDTEVIAKAIAERAKKEKYGDFSPEDLIWIVQGELEFGEASGE